MADFLDRLVSRARGPAPTARGLGGHGWSLEQEDVVTVPAPPPAATPDARPPVATAPGAAPATTAARPRRPPTPVPEASRPTAVHHETTVVRAPSPAPAPSMEPTTHPWPQRIPSPLPTDPAPLGEPVRARAEEHPAVVHAAPPERVTERTVHHHDHQVAREPLPVAAQPTVPESPARVMARPLVTPPAEPATRAPETAPVPPTVHIHIDRLDVRAEAEPSPVAPAPSSAAAVLPVVSLSDYLHGRAEVRP